MYLGGICNICCVNVFDILLARSLAYGWEVYGNTLYCVTICEWITIIDDYIQLCIYFLTFLNVNIFNHSSSVLICIYACAVISNVEWLTFIQTLGWKSLTITVIVKKNTMFTSFWTAFINVSLSCAKTFIIIIIII